MFEQATRSGMRADCVLSIIIVNYNGTAVLPRCLEALARDVPGVPTELIIVDNGSTDGSVDSIPDVGMPSRLILAGRNLGFAAANNLGAKAASGSYLLLVNTDCFVHPGLSGRLLSRLQMEPSAAVVGPRLLNTDGSLTPSCHNFPSPPVFFLEQTSLWRLLRHVPAASARLMIAGDHSSQREVDWVSGACMMISREAFESAGGFDERFFFYWEESDLCMRLRKS